MLFGLIRRSGATKLGSQFYPLVEGARLALETARKERLPLARIASQNGDDKAQYWFANNMLHVVLIEGRKPDTAAHVRLTLEKIDGLTLDDDMQALRATSAPEPRFVDLQVRHSEFVKYMKWLRTTQ